MSSAIANRLACVKAVLRGTEEVKHVSLTEGIQSVLRWYGVNRFLTTRRLKVTRIDNRLDWISLGPYGVAWPTGRPLPRLVGALVELWAPSNSHFYFSEGTEVHEGDDVIDVGACEGSFALECLVKHKAANVWCFEPDESMCHALEVTAERNGMAEKLHIFFGAVSRVSGAVRFLEDSRDLMASHVVDYSPSSEKEPLSTNLKIVASTSLDDWANETGLKKLDFLKIDAEGSDLDVLKGAKGCLERWRPSIAVTTYHHPNHCNEMVEYLTSLRLGYQFDVKGVISFDSIPRPHMLHAARND